MDERGGVCSLCGAGKGMMFHHPVRYISYFTRGQEPGGVVAPRLYQVKCLPEDYRDGHPVCQDCLRKKYPA